MAPVQSSLGTAADRAEAKGKSGETMALVQATAKVYDLVAPSQEKPLAPDTSDWPLLLKNFSLSKCRRVVVSLLPSRVASSNPFPPPLPPTPASLLADCCFPRHCHSLAR